MGPKRNDGSESVCVQILHYELLVFFLADDGGLSLYVVVFSFDGSFVCLLACKFVFVMVLVLARDGWHVDCRFGWLTIPHSSIFIDPLILKCDQSTIISIFIYFIVAASVDDQAGHSDEGPVRGERGPDERPAADGGQADRYTA